MPRRPLFVVGTGGLAREMAQLAHAVDRDASRWDFRGFVAATADEQGRDLGIGQVVVDDDSLSQTDESADLIIGVGHPAIRERIANRYLAKGDRFAFPNLIHPTANLDERFVRLGIGNVVTVGCVFTCDIEVGNFNLFNWNTTVGHDAVIGSYCVLNPSVNISGGVHVGDAVLIGVGAQVLENRVVHARATVGAGAVVTRDVPSGIVVTGVPARRLETGTDSG